MNKEMKLRVIKALEVFGITENSPATTTVRGKPGTPIHILRKEWPSIPETKLQGITAVRWAWSETDAQIQLVAEALKPGLPMGNDAIVIPVAALRSWVLLASLKILAEKAEITFGHDHWKTLEIKTDMWDPTTSDPTCPLTWGMRMAWQLLLAAHQCPTSTWFEVQELFKKYTIDGKQTVSQVVEKMDEVIAHVMKKHESIRRSQAVRQIQSHVEMAQTQRSTVWELPPARGVSPSGTTVRLTQFDLEVSGNGQAYVYQFKPFDPSNHPQGLSIYLVRSDKVYFAPITEAGFTASELLHHIRQVVTDARIVEILNVDTDAGIMTRSNGQVIIATEQSVVLTEYAGCTILHQLEPGQGFAQLGTHRPANTAAVGIHTSGLSPEMFAPR